MPTDLVGEMIPTKSLQVSLSRALPVNNPEVEAYVLNEIVKLIEEVHYNVVVLVDACTIRHDVRQEVNELIDKTHFALYAAPMGKTAISEQHECYGGVRRSYILSTVAYLAQIYIGSITDPKIKDKVENAPLILSIGALKSDFNTGMFTYRVPTIRTVEVCDH